MNVDHYKAKPSSLGVQDIDFIVAHDCGVFVARYAEYLSEGMDVPSVGFEAEYYRMRYESLLQKYSIHKVNKGYVSENDDLPRPRTKIIPIPDESGIVSIE
ncbi:hypothetical protein BC332_10473 [Capsicum chinense]|nr:hypothetical protein BC332_10473 [Capsicum chinense]